MKREFHVAPVREDEPELPLQLLNVGHITMEKDWNYGPICSPFLRIYWVEEGSAVMQFSDGERRLTPGHLYLTPAYSRHIDCCDSLFVHTYIHVLNRSYNSLYVS